jgi:hypothetical protein
MRACGVTSLGACDTAVLRFLLPALCSSAVFSMSASRPLPELLVGAKASGSVVLLVAGMAKALLVVAACLRVLSGVLLPAELLLLMQLALVKIPKILSLHSRHAGAYTSSVVQLRCCCWVRGRSAVVSKGVRSSAACGCCVRRCDDFLNLSNR